MDGTSEKLENERTNYRSTRAEFVGNLRYERREEHDCTQTLKGGFVRPYVDTLERG